MFDIGLLSRAECRLSGSEEHCENCGIAYLCAEETDLDEDTRLALGESGGPEYDDRQEALLGDERFLEVPNSEDLRCDGDCQRCQLGRHCE